MKHDQNLVALVYLHVVVDLIVISIFAATFVAEPCTDSGTGKGTN